MRCPECKVLNPPASSACYNCGLLLLAIAAPRRRKDDFATVVRRATDKPRIACPYCHGDVDSDAVRCRHCSQIVSESYRRERAIRVRSYLNYASWVAYIFGLFAFLVFKAVGLVAIASGLLLSIVYYAIPVAPTPSEEKKASGNILALLRRHLRFDRVAVPLPHFPRRRLVFVGTPLLAAVIGYFANFVLLQKPMNQILDASEAFSGMRVSTHYDYWIVPGVLVYDLKAVGKQTPLDVYTVLLEYAKELRSRPYREVKLLHRGEEKFTIDGRSFNRLGYEYSNRNFSWVLFEFPRKIRTVGAARKSLPSDEREALIAFHTHWYLNDLEKKHPSR